jgi:hypothetical protein
MNCRRSSDWLAHEKRMVSDEKVTNTDSPDAAWASVQRQRVLAYLASQKVEHAGVSLEPRWFLSPYVAIWAVRSKSIPEFIGWWAISGDLPTDYLTCEDQRDSGDILLSFARQWKVVAAKMAAGDHLPGYRIGPIDKAKELAPLLLARVELLEDFASTMKKSSENTPQ